VEITQDKIDLISKLVKNDRKYQGNEDLYEDFLNEACHRSVAIINAIDNETTLTAYLRKIVTTSIINVLKDSGRLRRVKTGYMTTNEVPLETVRAPEPITEAPVAAFDNIETVDYGSYNVDYGCINVPMNPEENAIQHEILDFVADTIQEINLNEPDEKYMEIFLLRYDRGMTQKEIASELGISQSEVSKRLYGLIDKVKSVLDEQ